MPDNSNKGYSDYYSFIKGLFLWSTKQIFRQKFGIILINCYSLCFQDGLYWCTFISSNALVCGKRFLQKDSFFFSLYLSSFLNLDLHSILEIHLDPKLLNNFIGNYTCLLLEMFCSGFLSFLSGLSLFTIMHNTIQGLSGMGLNFLFLALFFGDLWNG